MPSGNPQHSDELAPLRPTGTLDVSETLEQIDKRQKLEGLDTRYSRAMEDMIDMLFSQPQSSATTLSKWAAEHWEKWNSNPNYKNRVEQVKLKIRSTQQRIWDAIKKRIAAEEHVEEETTRMLRGLNASIRQTAMLGQAAKMVQTPYRIDDREQQKSALDTFEQEELRFFEKTLERLDEIDPGELVDMALENQEYMTMLADTAGLGKKFEKLGEMKYDIIDGKQWKKFDSANPNYEKNLNSLRDFILKSHGRGGPRSGLETDIWSGIIRAMNDDQRLDLIGQFHEDGKVSEALGLLFAMVRSNVISKKQAEVIIAASAYKDDYENEAKKDPAKYPDGLNSLRSTIKKDLETSEKLATALAAGEEEYSRALASQNIGSAATHFLTFNNFILSRLAEIGALTALINFGAGFSDAITNRKKGESLIKAGVEGIGKGINKLTVAGGLASYGAVKLALMGVPGSDSETEEEKEHLAAKKSAEWMRRENADHPKLMEYMLVNYEKLYKSAEVNQEKNPKRGLVPYMSSIQVSADEADKMGYGSGSAGVMKAKEKIVEFFKGGAAMGAITNAQLKVKLKDFGVKEAE